MNTIFMKPVECYGMTVYAVTVRCPLVVGFDVFSDPPDAIKKIAEETVSLRNYGIDLEYKDNTSHFQSLFDELENGELGSSLYPFCKVENRQIYFA